MKEIPWGATEKIPFQEICALWKQMLGINKKSMFYVTKIYHYIIYDLAALKALNVSGWIILASTFPDHIIFLEALLFNCILPFKVHSVFYWRSVLVKINYWSPGKKNRLCYVTVCSGSFYILLATDSQKVWLKINNQRRARFYYKVRQALLQSVTGLLYCKSRTIIIKKLCRFFVSRSGTSGILK